MRKVHTHTETITTDAIEVDTVTVSAIETDYYDHVVTTTVVVPNTLTYITTVAPTTTTVPTGSLFTPVAKAISITSTATNAPSTKGKKSRPGHARNRTRHGRKARRGLSLARLVHDDDHKSYPTRVDCTKYVTDFTATSTADVTVSTTITETYDGTYTYYVATDYATTSTAHAKTATVYQGCDIKNNRVN